MNSATLVHLFRESVSRYPARTAIVQGEREVDYATLGRWVGQIAGWLRSRGLRGGDRVGLLVQNSPEYAAIYYAVLSAGGCVVALNTATKARDLSNWLQHSEADWLFAESGHAELEALLDRLERKPLLVEIGKSRSNGAQPVAANLAEILDNGESDDDIHIRSGSDLAAIIYTSGTTGRPKGVMLSHRNLYENIRSILEYLKLDENDRIMNVLPFYYSYGNSVLHTHLAVGACVVLENSLLYPHKVLERMVEQRVTGFSGVPSTFGLLLNRTRLEDYDLSSVRYLTQAGGAMAPANIERIRKAVPHAEFFVMYGQTEASARLSWLPPQKLDEKAGSIGIAIPGVELGVFDEQGQRMPAGETGEICASGANIMMGYWKDPDMTAEVMRGEWLRTGDLAYSDDDGYLYIVGRSSEMIKSGANRISPKEIEEVILELDGVEEVAAVGVEDELLGQVIKAVIVPCRENAPDARAIQAYCRKNLASYKIPRQIEFVEEIPKTASGKIRRFMLQEKSLEHS